MSDKKLQSRERILRAAESILVLRGPVEPSVSEIMAAAGMTVGGFYAHFDSKESLMLEAFERLLSKRRAGLSELNSDLSLSERRSLMAAFYLSRRHRDSADSGCPLPASLSEIARLPESFREALARHLELIVAKLAQTPEQSSAVLADLAMMIGGLSLARALGPGDMSDRVLRAAKSAIV
ncbi:TetR/AcrR family transcriptional regulator [Pseudomonas segetis]|uniref:Transcriptional regulator, TetR family n=1 Tax=Pseudomonas segetis TaxID=298908 RepID=A0A239JYJ0_9PSED|nr:TetR/AcrR family transcriptional regulator [Pseudomonas segetis]SNT10855.1 transcriptional regulator, TetR family [Pseudomonas segetis]